MACDVGSPTALRDAPQVVGAYPLEGASGVPLDGPFIVNFDRRVSPRSVSRGSIRVASGNTSIFLSVRYDILEQRAVAVPFDGARLTPDVDYRLVIEGVEDLDGGVMAAPVTIHFHTGRDVARQAPVRATAAWGAVEPIFARSCATAACHDASFRAAGLDLSSSNGVATTAIGAPATTLPSGSVGEEGASGGPFFTGLRIVDVLGGVGRADTSYLVYTVLGDPHIYGDPMPPDAPLSSGEIATVVAWINAGAPTQ
ncbi:MAG: Ig-like domain-containing protein [Sandaracinaceae bacterium]|nr:Ig-like domain-containing protein [Sandaracinaceae bacterium]